MPEPTLDALETVFQAILAEMPHEFDSHEFCLRLAHRYQGLYVRALAVYADTGRPFLIVHGEIARRLLDHPTVVTKIGTRTSNDIFLEKQSNAVWRRVYQP